MLPKSFLQKIIDNDKIVDEIECNGIDSLFSRLQRVTKQINTMKSEKDLITKQQRQCKKEIQNAKAINVDIEKAQAIIQQVAKQTQKQLEFHLSELVTLALSSVFNNDTEMEALFQERRNKTELDLSFVRNGNKTDPLTEECGGMIDVAAFALQIVLLNLKTPKSRPVLILDEPLKHLKGGELPIKGAQMIKEISEKLGIQIIMVSHRAEQIEHADKVFTVTQNKKGISKVEEA